MTPTWYNSEQAQLPRFKRNRMLRKIVDDIALGGFSTHSGNATTLPFVISELERRKIPYEIKAIPGSFYQITGNTQFPTVSGKALGTGTMKLADAVALARSTAKRRGIEMFVVKVGRSAYVISESGVDRIARKLFGVAKPDSSYVELIPHPHRAGIRKKESRQ